MGATANKQGAWQVQHQYVLRPDLELAGNEERFRKAFTHAPLAQAFITPDGSFVACNEQWFRYLGYDAIELFALTAWDVTHPDDVDASLAAVDSLVRDERDVVTLDKRYVRADGEVVHARTALALVRDDDGRPLFVNGIIEDVTARVRAEAILDGEMAFYEALEQDATDDEQVRVLVETAERLVPEAWGSVMFADSDAGVLRLAAGPSLPDDLREAIAEVPIEPDMGVCGRAAATRQVVVVADVLADERCRPWYDSLAGAGVRGCWSIPIVSPHGALVGTFAMYHRGAQLPGDEQLALTERWAKFAGVTVARYREREALRTDPELGLPNRSRLLELLGCDAAEGRERVLLALDVRRFMDVVTALGRSISIGVLRGVRDRLRQFLDDDDVLAYLGGDRFAILCDGHDHHRGRSFVEDISFAFSAPLVVEGFPFHLEVRVGVASGQGGERLVQQAEAALGHAKETDQLVVRFQPGVEAPYARRLAFAREFREALEGGELFLEYQPKFSLPEARPAGVECLVRWRTADGTQHPPAQFVPLAEQTGLMPRLTRYVLLQAARQWRSWRHVGIDATLAVNVSATDVGDPAFEAALRELLSEIGMPPERLQLEITETSVMAHPEQAVTSLRRLRALGITIAIDDFGVGQSSLTYLRHFPVDVLKIDRSFMLGLDHDPSRQAIVRAIVEVAHALSLRCVAEGVETAAVLDVLTDLGCDEVQGYHLAAPLPEPAVRAVLQGVSVS